MPYLPQQKLRIVRSTLTNQVMALIQGDFIEDIGPSELIEASSVSLFYLVLRHLKSHDDRVQTLLSTSEDFDNAHEYYVRYDLLADFTLRVHRNPPLKQHNVLLNAVHDAIGSFRGPSTVAAMQTAFQHARSALFDYLSSLADIASDKTANSKTMEKYFRQHRNFYYDSRDPLYKSSFENSNLYKENLRLKNAIISKLAPIPQPPTVTQYTPTSAPRELIEFLTSTHVYDMECLEIDDLAFPLIGGYFPNSMRLDILNSSSAMKAIAARFEPESDLNDDPDTRPRNSYEFSISETEFIANNAAPTVPSTPFPEGFFDHTSGLSPDPNAPNANGPGSPDPSSNPPGGSAPAIPDDTSYVPDALLASLAAAHTALVHASPAAYANQDHMTRFRTTSEAASSVSRAQMTNNDFFIMKRDRYGNQMFMVTYTRMSQKPIFSFVA